MLRVQEAMGAGHPVVMAEMEATQASMAEQLHATKPCTAVATNLCTAVATNLCMGVAAALPAMVFNLHSVRREASHSVTHCSAKCFFELQGPPLVEKGAMWT